MTKHRTGTPEEWLAARLEPLEHCGLRWLRAFTPFFTPTVRRQAACQHRLFLAQVEY